MKDTAAGIPLFLCCPLIKHKEERKSPNWEKNMVSLTIFSPFFFLKYRLSAFVTIAHGFEGRMTDDIRNIPSRVNSEVKKFYL